LLRGWLAQRRPSGARRPTETRTRFSFVLSSGQPSKRPFGWEWVRFYLGAPMEPRRDHDSDHPSRHDPVHPSRRAFIAGAAHGCAAAASAITWSPAFRATPADARTAAATQAPPSFPSSIPVYQQAYQNWSGAIAIDNVWTCAPATANDVVTLAN